MVILCAASLCGEALAAPERLADVLKHVQGSVVYHGVEGLRAEFRRPSTSPEEASQRLDQATFCTDAHTPKNPIRLT